MGRKRKYRNAAEKQRAWRIRHGQVEKVPLAIRRGERLGTSEAQLRERRKDETWEEYDKYIRQRVEKAHAIKPNDGEETSSSSSSSIGAKRAAGKYTEPTFTKDYYELRRKYEADLEALEKKGRKIKKE